MGVQVEVLRFGPFELDRESGELRRSGTRMKLAPQPLRLLELLTGQAPHIVSGEAIRSALWSEGTYVEFDQGITSCIAQLRGALGDDARSPRYIETLHKRGYRFIAPVTEEPEPRGIPGNPTPINEAIHSLAARRQRAVAPAIAILPFDCLSGCPDERRLAAGLTDDLISRVVRSTPFHIVSRTSVLQFRGLSQPLPEIAAQLGADWILEGSVLSEGSRVRVNVQLVHGKSDLQSWAGVYRRQCKGELTWERRMAQTIAREVSLALGEIKDSTVRHNPQAGQDCVPFQPKMAAGLRAGEAG